MKCSSCGHWNRIPVNKITKSLVQVEAILLDKMGIAFAKIKTAK